MIKKILFVFFLIIILLGIVIAPPQQCLDQDGDGVCDVDDKCSNTPNNLAVNSVGCSHKQFCDIKPICGVECYNASWFGQNYYGKRKI